MKKVEKILEIALEHVAHMETVMDATVNEHATLYTLLGDIRIAILSAKKECENLKNDN